MNGRRVVHPDDESRAADELARELEALGAMSAVVPEAGFTDRVMAAIAAEPLPQPARAFGVALLAGRLRAAASAVGDAWRVTTSGFAPALVRAQALSLVLLVGLVSLGVVGGTSAAALGLLESRPSPAPIVPGPSPNIRPAPSGPPSSTPEPTPSASTDTTEPTETPEATDGGSQSRTASPGPTGTDDHGGGSGSGSGSDGGSGSGSGSGTGSGSGSGSGSGGGHDGGTQTAEPTGTDDHGGSSDG